MRRRSVGALARYKTALRRIKRDRTKAPAIKYGVLRRQSGEWDVWAPPVAGPPFVRAQHMAGPFDTRDEALDWITENP